MKADAVGMIGIGAMGSAMARSLIEAGYPVVGFDVRPERLDLLEEMGGKRAGSPAEVGDRADPVILSLPATGPLTEVVSGAGGLVDSRDGIVCVETSTLPVAAKQSARAVLGEIGIELLDCPISGTGEQARHKDLVFYAGGPEELVERVRPVLEAVGRGVYRVGDFGDGVRMKLVANLLVSIHTAAAAEALTLAAKTGLDVAQAQRVLSDGAGTSRMLEVRGPMMVAGEFPGDTATVEILDKDIGLILDLARDEDCPVPMLGLASSLFRAARGQGLGRHEPAVVAEVFARLAGLRPSMEEGV